MTRPRLGFVGIVALAFAVRVGLGVSRGDDLLAEGNGLYYMHEIAESLSMGNGYATANGNPNVFQQPGYPSLLAFGYAVMGVSWKGVVLANALAGSALVAATIWLAERVRPGIGYAAGILTALHPFLVWHGMSVADTVPFALMQIGWLAAVLAIDSERTPRRAIWLGVWTAGAFYIRPSLLFVLPVGLAFLWLRRPKLKETAQTVGIVAVTALALLMPWLLRNAALTGSFPLIGTHGPESMWAANTDGSPQATEMDSSYDAVSAQPFYRGTDLDIGAFQSGVPPKEAVRREAVFKREMSEWIRANPGTFAEMSMVRLRRIWDPLYHPTTWWGTERPRVREKTIIHAIGLIPLLLLAALGIWQLRRDRSSRARMRFLVAVVAVYSLTHCTGAGYSRVRLPIDPVLIVFASVPLTQWFGRFRKVKPSASEAQGEQA